MQHTTVTLQLINSRGLYAGPVVVGGSASTAIVGFKAPANVGTIIVVPSKGYAHLAHDLAAKYLDRSRRAYAKQGVPIGNGDNFGLVVSKTTGTDDGAGLDPAHVGPQAPSDLLSPGRNQLDDFTLFPNATSARVGSGDVATEDVTANRATTQIPTTLAFVLVTTPALAAYADTAGHSGAITYPEPTITPPASDTDLGTTEDPIEVAPSSNGDVVMTLTFYRPQRLGAAGAGKSEFMDIGNLSYRISATPFPPSGPQKRKFR